MDDALLAAWQRLLAELDRHAPATRAAMRAPAPSYGDEEVRLPVALSTELRSWFGLHGGFEPWFHGQIFPFCTAIDLHTAVEDSLLRRQLWQGPPLDEGDLRKLAKRAAGGVARTWLDPYVAIGADGMGGGLFVDLRSGAQSGCVRWWDKVDADDLGVLAPNITVLLNDVARSLRSGRPVGGWIPNLVDGIIAWEEEK